MPDFSNRWCISLIEIRPQGVAMGMKPSPVWLKDGDVIEVSLEGVGSCINKVVFQKSRPKL